MDIFELIPYDHFGETQLKIMRDLRNGESCLIYGMNGSGVQYFLRLTEKRLLAMSKHVLFFRGSLIQNDAVAVISNEIVRLAKKENLNDALNTFKPENKLYIFIDKFQQIKNTEELLNFLGTIRKTNPHNVVNVIGTDQSYLGELANYFKKNDSAISAVYRLIPFDIVGVRKMITINNQFFNWQIPIDYAEKLLKLSGGNPRLVKYISKVLMEEGLNQIDDKELLANHTLLEPKLTKFIEILFQFDISDLKTLNIINEKGELFSELVKYKVENYEIPNLEELFPELTNRERKVFSYLFINKGRLVSTQKMDFIFNLIDDSYSLWASYKAINRLKKKLEGRFELKNVKGRGYILND